MRYSMRPLLDALNEGRGLRTGASILLRLMAGLTVVGGLYGAGKVLVGAFDLSVGGAIGAIIFALLLALAVVGIAQVLWYRGDEVSALEDSPLTAIPIVSQLARAAGESYAVLSVAVGIGGCIFIWLSNLDPWWVLGGWGTLFPAMEAGNAFTSGILFLVSVWVYAALSLFFFYVLAELIVVLADIANNVRALRDEAREGDRPV